ncbi:uncharacterized protein LOC120077397 [Benincasa hispida]|uniref:uncharacterized protein LOC120077397 n=1 Tax=Benincasa hispida TaxID=102211 RepID=UPI0019000247|nr:uncharacterized protein LOC120077397 [Benincasa hispida]
MEEVSVIPLYISTLPKCLTNQGFHPNNLYVRRIEEILSTSRPVLWKMESDSQFSPTYFNTSLTSLPSNLTTHNLGDDVDQGQYFNDWSLRENDDEEEPKINTHQTPHAEERTIEDYGGSSHATGCDLSHPSSSTITMPGQSYSSEDVQVGDIFISKKDLKMWLSMLAIRVNFQFRVKKSTTTLYKVIYLVEECKSKLRAVKLKNCEIFKISKYDNFHTCRNEILTNNHRQASSWVLRYLISSKFEDVSHSYRPKDIVKDIKQEYSVSLSYDKAWRAREEVLVLVWGSLEESYKKLPKFGEALQIENPGSAFKYDLQEDKYFKYVFMALGASIRVFLNCIQPVLIVDGTRLRDKYSGKLLLAIEVDENNQIYSVAFGIFGRETDESWVWFLQQLRCVIGQVYNLVIVSDRHPSIKKEIITVFPKAFNGICIHHLKANLLVNFKNKDIFDKAAKANRESVFKYHWSQFAGYPGAHKYLEDIGLERGARMYQYHIRGWLQDLYHRRRMEASNNTSRLSNYAMTIIRDAADKASRYEVRPIDQHEFEVIDGGLGGRVNIHARMCTCRKFDYYEIPCSHAIVA